MKIFNKFSRKISTYKRKTGHEVKQIVLPQEITSKISDTYFLYDREEFNEIHVVIKYKK